MLEDEHQRRLEVKFGACTKKGTHKVNEDAFAAFVPDNTHEQNLRGAIACIADGLGGSVNACRASQLACDNITLDYYSAPALWSVKKALAQTIHALNDWFVSQSQVLMSSNLADDAQAPNSAFATTFSCVVIKSNTAHIFHAGDSRIYLLRDGELEQLTQDHVGAHGGLSTYLNQALGLHLALSLDYLKVAVAPGDCFLLTSDGVHQSLSHRKLAELSADTSNLERCAERIVQAAMEHNNHDDATALLVQLRALPSLEPQEIFGNYASLGIPPVLAAGDKIDQYRVVKRLAPDSRSLIYLVVNELDDLQYILKAPSKKYSQDLEYMEGFALEHWLAGKLDSPYLMKLYPRQKDSVFFYHVCEYIQGPTLRQWMRNQGPFSLIETQAILHAMVQSVRVLHRNGIIHRDLKPENFIYDKNGTLKLIDFGTAELASLKDGWSVPTLQNPVGDIGYLAPEYLVAGSGSANSDLYSLATIVYELLSSELPYAALLDNRDSPRDYDYWRYRSIFKTQKPTPYLPYWLDNVLKKALAPQPATRFQRLAELEENLKKPAVQYLQKSHDMPLLHKNPLRFYQVVSAVLFLILLAQAVWPYLER